MTKDNKQDNTNDIYTIFTYRYVFDKQNDVVNLKADILDLQQFPERLMGSYKAEWEKYNKKAANEQSLDINKQNTSLLVASLSTFQRKELSELLSIIENTVTINNSKNIKVIKSDFKSYIESLLKL